MCSPGTGQPNFQVCDDVARNVWIRSLVGLWQAHLEIIGHSDDPLHTLCGAFCGKFLCITSNEPGQGDDPVFDRYRNVGRIDIGLPSQLFFNVAFDFAVGSHMGFPHMWFMASYRAITLPQGTALTTVSF
jgi:hypothetical protein